MADPSSIILDVHLVLDPLKHELTDLIMQTWILALPQPITAEYLSPHFCAKCELNFLM